MADLSWSELYERRKAVQGRYRRVWSVPLARRPTDVLRQALSKQAAGGPLRLLEIGASDRRLRDRLKGWFPTAVYESMDIDRRQPHDYHSLEEVAGPYDAVVLFEVLEHLSLEDGRRLMEGVRRVLRPGGAAVLSTPNVFNPSRFWRDATHQVAYAYDELGGLLDLCGLVLKRLVRTHNDPVHRLVLRRYVFGWLFRLLNLDYADSIVAVAERPLEADG